MPLYTPKRNSGSSRYCGPTAIMAVTGERGSDVRDAIRQARGNIMSAAGTNMPVAGLSNSDLLSAMSILGWDVTESWRAPERPRAEFVPIDRSKVKNEHYQGRAVWHKGNGEQGIYKRPPHDPLPKFRDFLIERGDGGPFIVNVTGHYMAVAHGEVCDAATTILPTEISHYLRKPKGGYRNSWVWAWWKFEQVGEAA